MESRKLKGLDSLLSIVQMPKGIPVGSVAIGEDLSLIHISEPTRPERMFKFAKAAEDNNISVIIAGAGGSAHLPGMIASLTTIPVIGVPVESRKLKGLDSLLSIVQMPKGIPVGSVAIGEDGAMNAGLYAASIIALTNKDIKKNLKNYRSKQSKAVRQKP